VIHPSVTQFTQAIDFKGLAGCPQDARWQIPTDSDICTEVETLQLLFGFVRMLRPKVVVETGCNVGMASRVICEALRANADGGILYTCDVDASFVAATQMITAGIADVWHCGGLALVQQFPDARLYWIDSSEDSRAQELEWLREHGKPGAIVLVHDTSLMGELARIVRSFPRHIILPGPRGLGGITL